MVLQWAQQQRATDQEISELQREWKVNAKLVLCEKEVSAQQQYERRFTVMIAQDLNSLSNPQPVARGCRAQHQPALLSKGAPPASV